jgi:hypothetical protein
MKRTKVLLVSVVSIVGLTAATAGIGAMGAGSAVAEMATGAQMAAFGDRSGGWGHRFGGHGRRGMAMLCSDRRDAKIADTIEFVESFVDFTPEQTTAWEDLKTAVASGSTKVGAACAEIQKAGRPDTAVEKLAFMENMMSTGLSILQEVRPAFETFYGTLDERQKKAIDKLMSHRHHRRS